MSCDIKDELKSMAVFAIGIGIIICFVVISYGVAVKLFPELNQPDRIEVIRYIEPQKESK